MMDNLKIRWLITKDYENIADIEEKSFDVPWSIFDIKKYLKRQNVIGLIAEIQIKDNFCLIGYIIYELNDKNIYILNLAVDPLYRREKIGTQLIEKIISKLSPERQYITTEIKETNLPAQIFFKKMGFTAIKILKNFYDGSKEDAYTFRYKIQEAVLL